MDVMHPRCAGIDISKKDAKVCVRIQGQGRRRTVVDGDDLGCDDQPDPGAAGASARERKSPAW